MRVPSELARKLHKGKGLMSVHGRMLSLVRQIYSAADDETRWPTVLEHLADEYQGGVAGLQYRAGVEGRVRPSRFVRLDPAIQRAYGTHFATRNPWTRLSQPIFRPGFVFLPESALPLTQLRRTEFYDGILRPAGVVHCFGACVLRRGDDVLSFTVVRSQTRGPYDVNELTSVRAILPHLQRAVEVNERLSHLERTRASLADGLDYLQHGVLIVNRFGRVVFANQAARAIVALQDGLTIAADGLVAAAREDRRKLRSLLDDSVSTASGKGFGSGGVMTVARPSMKRPFLLLVAPLKLALEGEGSFGMSTVFISDPEARVEAVNEATRRRPPRHASRVSSHRRAAWNRQPSNCTSAMRLCAGTYGTSTGKTGTHRQAALLRLLIDVPSRLKPGMLPPSITSRPSH